MSVSASFLPIAPTTRECDIVPLPKTMSQQFKLTPYRNFINCNTQWQLTSNTNMVYI